MNDSHGMTQYDENLQIFSICLNAAYAPCTKTVIDLEDMTQDYKNISGFTISYVYSIQWLYKYMTPCQNNPDSNSVTCGLTGLASAMVRHGKYGRGVFA